ncbi:MAG: transcriptional regulator [Gammaproteobacteria bacterium]|nr:transcriptional regulator [Gammaproteobacteria bacterium]
MVLTRDFKETIAIRVQKDTRFRRALLVEAIGTLLDGDLDTGKALLRDYINATIGFEVLAKEIGKDSKSIHRMLGPKGNPTADNIFTIVKILQDVTDISLHVKASHHKAA